LLCSGLLQEQRHFPVTPRICQIRRDGEAPLATTGPTTHPIAAGPNTCARSLGRGRRQGGGCAGELQGERREGVESGSRRSRGPRSSTSSRPLRRRELLGVLGERPGVLHGRRASSVRAPPVAAGDRGTPRRWRWRWGGAAGGGDWGGGGNRASPASVRRGQHEEAPASRRRRSRGRSGGRGEPRRRRRCVAIRRPRSGELEAVIRPPPPHRRARGRARGAPRWRGSATRRTRTRATSCAGASTA
jgi:hypothetical protein